MRAMALFSPIITERVLLRPLRVEEAPEVVAYRRDPRVARYQGWGVVDPGEIERDLAGMAGRTPCDVPGPWFQLAIVEVASDALAGDLGVRLLGERPDAAEIGYTVAPGFQRLGYATDAVRAMCDWMLGPRALARVIATIDASNLPSLLVIERSGFVRIAAVETKHAGVAASLLTYERRAPA
jgi:RimJ/RimL family protein N-acetyltransferase